MKTHIFILFQAEVEENYDIDSNGKFTKIAKIDPIQAVIPYSPQEVNNKTSVIQYRCRKNSHLQKRAHSNLSQLPQHVTMPSFHAEQITQF